MKLVIELDFDTSEISSVMSVLEALKKLENNPGVRLNVSSDSTHSPGHAKGASRGIDFKNMKK